MGNFMKLVASVACLLSVAGALPAAQVPQLENPGLRLEVSPSDGSARLVDKRTGVEWNLGGPRLVMKDKSTRPVKLSGAITGRGGTLAYGADNPAYILAHVLYAEMPVYGFGSHRYWTNAAAEPAPGGREMDRSRMAFAKGERLSNVNDQFIKNTYEVLSPLGRDTALLPMTDHRFVTPDRKVESTRFGADTNITVNYGESDYSAAHAVLPQWGFVIESPTLVAFYARSYGGVKYAEPSLFVIHSLDGKPLSSSRQVRIYRGFGDKRVEFRGKTIQVDSEKVIS